MAQGIVFSCSVYIQRQAPGTCCRLFPRNKSISPAYTQKLWISGIMQKQGTFEPEKTNVLKCTLGQLCSRYSASIVINRCGVKRALKLVLITSSSSSLSLSARRYIRLRY